MEDIDTSDWTQEDWANYYDAMDGAGYKTDEQYWKEQMDLAEESLSEAREELKEKQLSLQENMEGLVKYILDELYTPELRVLREYARDHQKISQSIAESESKVKSWQEAFEANRSEYWNAIPEMN